MKIFSRFFIPLLFLLLLSFTVQSQNNCVSENYKVGDIEFQVKQPHRLIEENLNHKILHFIYQPTKHSTIKKYLVFKKGEIFDLKKIKESIRKLREQKFIWDVFFKISEGENCTKNVLLIINDTFPFKPKISFSRRSRVNKSSIGIENNNLFGTGNSLKFEFKHEKQRDQKIIRYIDPNFGVDHYIFSSLYSDNSDGKESLLQITKPFHQLDTEISNNFLWNDFQGELQIYNDSDIIFHTPITTNHSSIGHAFSTDGLFQFERTRIFFDLSYDEGYYDLLNQYNRKIISTGMKFQLFDSDYIEVKNVRNMSQFEDYNQGLDLSFGMSLKYDQLSQKWGTGIDLFAKQSIVQNKYVLINYEVGLRSILFDSKELSESKLFGKVVYNHFSPSFQQSWNVKLNLEQYQNIRPENLILMDEEFSVRGFPYGYKSGNSLVSMNIEKRWFNLLTVFDVFDIAMVGFIDVGKISNDQFDLIESESSILSSYGIGLRISPTKLSNHTVIHVDLAFPQANDLDQNYQLNIFGLNRF